MTDDLSGADDRARTGDLRFTIPLLYQLSYIGADVPPKFVHLRRRLLRAASP